MRRLTRAVAWVFFAGIMYLILAETVWQWVELPSLGNIGFTLVFVVFAVAHCAVQQGWRRTGVFFAVSAIVSYCMEEIGVRSGLVFGAYHYGGLLGPKLGHVPVIIPLAWFMMIYPSWMVARELLRGVDGRGLAGMTAISIAAAFVMTGWDVVMDPGMAAGGNWIWEKGGAYFGVPRHNYLGWLMTTFLVYWIVGLLWRRVRTVAGAGRLFEALPVVVYAFFAVRYVIGSRMPAMQVIAIFSMGLAGVLALMQIGLNPKGESQTA